LHCYFLLFDNIQHIVVFFLKFQTFLALLLLITGSLTTFMQYIQVFSIIMSLLVLTALLYLRRYRPDIHRPYKVSMLAVIDHILGLGLWCLTTLSILFQLYHGGGNRSTQRKPLTCRKSLTNFMT
jgi:amino acid transporter